MNKHNIILTGTVLAVTIALFMVFANFSKHTLEVTTDIPGATISVERFSQDEIISKTTDYLSLSLGEGEYIIRVSDGRKTANSVIFLEEDTVIQLNNYDFYKSNRVSSPSASNISLSDSGYSFVSPDDYSAYLLTPSGGSLAAGLDKIGDALYAESLGEGVFVVITTDWKGYAVYRSGVYKLTTEGNHLQFGAFSVDDDKIYILTGLDVFLLDRSSVVSAYNSSQKTVETQKVLSLQNSYYEIAASNDSLVLHTGDIDADIPDQEVLSFNTVYSLSTQNSYEMSGANTVSWVAVSPDGTSFTYVPDSKNYQDIVSSSDQSLLSRTGVGSVLAVDWSSNGDIYSCTYEGLWQYETAFNTSKLISPGVCTDVDASGDTILVALGGDQSGIYELYSDSPVFSSVIDSSYFPKTTLDYRVDYFDVFGGVVYLVEPYGIFNYDWQYDQYQQELKTNKVKGVSWIKTTPGYNPDSTIIYR